MSRSKFVCHCADHGCPVHRGMECTRVGTRELPIVTLYRLDMEDRTGTQFCTLCAADAASSGLFTDGERAE